MVARSKRYKSVKDLIEVTKSYNVKEAIGIIRKNYSHPLDSLTYTWIDRERKRLIKWKNTINSNKKIYN